MNSDLWRSIDEFDLDLPLSEYSFSIRLAHENAWPACFTAKAIQEYKKFMYLAATANGMVSPSEIVDVVWHQHLIFTQSYDNFCKILGRKIEHIPSTHRNTEKHLFTEARERTAQLYLETFGDMPADIWQYTSIYDSLNMPKSRFSSNEEFMFAFLLTGILTVPAYYLLKPLYMHIHGLQFLWYYIPIFAISMAGLWLYNELQFKKLPELWRKDSFVMNLSPFELLYIKNKEIRPAIHACVNLMLEENKIMPKGEYILANAPGAKPNNAAQMAIADVLDANTETSYYDLFKAVMDKPVFTNTATFYKQLQIYMSESQFVSNVCRVNYVVISTLTVLCTTRLITGIENNKPVGFLIVTMLVSCIAFFVAINHLFTLHTKSLQNYYEEEVIPTHPEAQGFSWQFYLLGYAVFNSSFVTMYHNVEQQYRSVTADSGSSDSGGSCGGGGGCGGGCGGCGG
ncbi:MAG TPA: hypothetical protein PLW44_15415 [Chitinophagales bacterium]|nr:hypothetical protein [Chitinophagales bacterium]